MWTVAMWWGFGTSMSLSQEWTYREQEEKTLTASAARHGGATFNPSMRVTEEGGLVVKDSLYFKMSSRPDWMVE